MLVSWSTCDAVVSRDVPPLPTPPPAAAAAAAPGLVSGLQSTAGSQVPVVLYGTAPGNYSKQATGTTTSYVYNYTQAEDGAGLSYASPLIHHVLLTGKPTGHRVGERMTAL